MKVKCIFCGEVFKNYEGKEVEIGKWEDTFCLNMQIFPNCTFFQTHGQYGSTIIDDLTGGTEEHFEIIFHDECLKKCIKDGRVLMRLNGELVDKWYGVNKE